MNPELVEQADGLHGHDHDWREADERQPQPEDERHETASPGLAQGRAQVKALRRMVDDMRSPEEPAFMADAVKPVVGEIFCKEYDGPGPPLIADVENGKAVDRGICAEYQRLADDADEHVTRSHAERGRSVLELV